MKTIGEITIWLNKGLMNTKGNLIRIVNTIVFPGVSVDGTESKRLKQEKANPAKIIPIITIIKLIESGIDRNNIPIIKGTEVKIIP